MDLGRIPEGWAAATSFPRVRLARGESATVFAVVRVPLDAHAGDTHRMTVRVKPNRFTPRFARRSIHVRVVDLDVPAGPEAALATAPAPSPPVAVEA